MTALVWIGFIAVVLGLLVADLGIFNKKERAPTVSRAMVLTSFYVTLALGFNVLVYFLYREGWGGFGDLALAEYLAEHAGVAAEAARVEIARTAALQFLTGYLVEESLSADNIFVMALIFGYFRVPGHLQHRVLFWGILGAIVLRGLMIAVGAALIERFHWMMYVFGVILILSAIRLLLASEDEFDPESNALVRLLRRFYPVTSEFEGRKFFTMENGRRAVTPLFVTLLVVESTDVIFAVDSIPAIFAITRDPFLVFTSNVFAILGLRSMYFALAGMMEKFRHLKTALVFLLAFIGVKMLIVDHYPIPTPVSLAVIAGILLVGVLASLVAARRETAPPA